MADVDFEGHCRWRFKLYCDCYAQARYHSLKKKYMEKAYAAIDDYLTFKEIQDL
jgi:hypothetical protein